MEYFHQNMTSISGDTARHELRIQADAITALQVAAEASQSPGSRGLHQRFILVKTSIYLIPEVTAAGQEMRPLKLS